MYYLYINNSKTKLPKVVKKIEIREDIKNLGPPDQVLIYKIYVKRIICNIYSKGALFFSTLSSLNNPALLIQVEPLSNKNIYILYTFYIYYICLYNIYKTNYIINI